MQFGRFHGIALLVLGGLLLLVQAVALFEPRSSEATKTTTSERHSETGSQAAGPQFSQLLYLPGAIGLALVGGGIFVLVQEQRRVLRTWTRTHETRAR